MKFIIGPLVYLFPQTFWLWTLHDEVYYRPFGLLVPKDFWLWTLPDEVYSSCERNNFSRKGP
jgi:hypothetical protein